MNNKHIQQGLQRIKAAISHDEKNELQQALDNYRQGIALYLEGRKSISDPKLKSTILTRVNSYFTRAESIKKQLEKKANKPAPVNTKPAPSSSPAPSPAHTPKPKPSTPKTPKQAEDKEDSGEKGEEKEEKKLDPETEKLRKALSGAIVSEAPNVHWDDVAGLHQAKRLLQEAVIMPIKFPHFFTGKRSPWKGILLYGPPGTGKSFLAKAVATEAGASCFLSVSSSDLVSKYQGESERLVKNLFELARLNSPAIIFVDEVDSLCGSRDGGGGNDSGRRIITEFLVQMQGVGKGNDGILVLGATNTPWELDSAIRRRFEKRVYIPLPDEEARARIFEISVGDTPNNLTEDEYKRLAQKTQGFSGSDISVMVRDALYEPVRTCQIATHFHTVPDPQGEEEVVWQACSPGEHDAQEKDVMDVPPALLRAEDVSMRHFLSALHTAKPSVGPDDLTRLEEWTTQFGQDG